MLTAELSPLASVVTTFGDPQAMADDQLTDALGTGTPFTSTALTTKVHDVDRVGQTAPSPETLSSRAGARGCAAENCAVAVTLPLVARIVVVPSLSARTSTYTPVVVDRLPTEASAIDHVTGTPGTATPLASRTVAANRAVPLIGAIADVGAMVTEAAVTITGVDTDCVPLAAASVVTTVV